MELASRELIIAIIWFMVGFGAGLFILSFWKYLLMALVAAVILPIVLGVFGLNVPITPGAVVDALLLGLDMLADILARNSYGFYGFVAGVAIGLMVAIIRLQRAAKTPAA